MGGGPKLTTTGYCLSCVPSAVSCRRYTLTSKVPIPDNSPCSLRFGIEGLVTGTLEVQAYGCRFLGIPVVAGQIHRDEFELLMRNPEMHFAGSPSPDLGIAVSVNWGFRFVGVMIIRVLLLGVYIGAPDCWNSHKSQGFI